MELMEETNDPDQQEIQEHHEKTGCCGQIKAYKVPPENGTVEGYFCTCCKKEWLSGDKHKNPPPSVDHKPVAPHLVPSFWYIQTSDTGNYVRWRNITSGALAQGDHVAWLRVFSYWHHAIVENINLDKDGELKSINVIEWSSGRCSTHIHLRPVEYGCLERWGCSFMYKAHYPKRVTDLNPPELVLMRARARLDDTGYGPFADNCEHFATFCKTGQHRCNQLHQLKVTMRAWLRRFLVTFLHIAIIVSLAETIERYSMTGKDWVGAVLLLASEMIYLLIFFCIVYCVDTRREWFTMNQDPECTRACRCASIKAVLQSITLVAVSTIFSVYVERWIEKSRGPWSITKQTGVQIGLGILGGCIGNALGFLAFSLIPYPCCRNEIPLDDLPGKRENVQPEPRRD